MMLYSDLNYEYETKACYKYTINWLNSYTRVMTIRQMGKIDTIKSILQIRTAET